MSAIDYNTWVDEDTYMEEMAKMHKLDPKLQVIEVLLHEFQQLQSDQNYKPEFPSEVRRWRLAEYSGQIVALSMELTDDLAAVCTAYLETLANKDKAFIERIANFELGEGHKFYEAVANNVAEAARAIGLDPSSSSSAEQENVRLKFAQIKDMRKKFWHWYTGYKHGQYATPIVLTIRDQEKELKQEWGFYLIPRPLRRDTVAKKVHTEDKFINTVDNVALFYSLAVECVSLAIQTRDRQFPKVFGHLMP